MLKAMPSDNPRYRNWKARERVRRDVKRRVLAGEPCGICGKPIDLSLPQWHVDADGRRKRAPWSMEVDEIVPISLGGSPIDPANTQPAHRLCNLRKGNGKKQRSSNAKAIDGETSRDW